MHIATRTKHHGFTLIELSVVLIIIGLIVAGVLLGHDLISDAKLKKNIRDIQSFRTAYYTFKGKYNAIPGDMRSPNVFWSELGSATGDGNGYISGNINSVTAEPILAWQELSLAQMVNIPTPVTSAYVYGLAPNSGVPTFWYYQDYTGYPINRTGNSIHMSGTVGIGSAASGLTVMQAYQIDTKLDDGSPEAGRIRGLPPVSGGLANDTCGGNVYALPGDGELGCRLMYFIE